MVVHTAESRGRADHGWLKSHHTFSFADYYDPERMGFGSLRVINDDVIQRGRGFGTHSHRNMEIITIPLKGTLLHKDSEGHSYQIRRGEVQIMSAGTGIAHSEFASPEEDVSLYQIWVLPKKKDIPPRYEQKSFDLSQSGQILLISPDGREGSLTINQDAYFTYARLKPGEELIYKRNLPNGGLYTLVVEGEVDIQGKLLKTRDALGITDLSNLRVTTGKSSEILLMEVPMSETGN